MMKTRNTAMEQLAPVALFRKLVLSSVDWLGLPTINENSRVSVFLWQT